MGRRFAICSYTRLSSFLPALASLLFSPSFSSAPQYLLAKIHPHFFRIFKNNIHAAVIFSEINLYLATVLECPLSYVPFPRCLMDSRLLEQLIYSSGLSSALRTMSLKITVS